MYNNHAMSELKIKHRLFEVVEIIKNDTFKCERKNKTFYIKKYDMENSDSRMKFQNALNLYKSAVNLPKYFIADKKTGYLVKEYLDGVLMSDYILDHDFDENIYKQIFLSSYMAKVAKLSLNYDLDAWMLVGDKLYYVDDFCDKYNSDHDFVKDGMTKWFFTKDLAKYYEKNGVLFDKSRIKEECAVNKEMVLMACKYYQ